MRLNWAGTARWRTKLSKQRWRRLLPLDKQTSSQHWELGGSGRDGRGKEGAGFCGPWATGGTQECGALASGRGISGSKDRRVREADCAAGARGLRQPESEENMEK